MEAKTGPPGGPIPGDFGASVLLPRDLRPELAALGSTAALGSVHQLVAVGLALVVHDRHLEKAAEGRLTRYTFLASTGNSQFLRRTMVGKDGTKNQHLPCRCPFGGT